MWTRHLLAGNGKPFKITSSDYLRCHMRGRCWVVSLDDAYLASSATRPKHSKGRLTRFCRTSRRTRSCTATTCGISSRTRTFGSHRSNCKPERRSPTFEVSFITFEVQAAQNGINAARRLSIATELKLKRPSDQKILPKSTLRVAVPPEFSNTMSLDMAVARPCVSGRGLG